MKEWLASREPRERVVLLGGAAAFVLIVLWAFVLKPLHTETAALRDAVAAKQRLIVNLGRVEGSKLGGATPQGGGRPGRQTLTVLINSTAQSRGLTLPRITPQGSDVVSVTFQNASFDALLGWLVSLDTEYSIAVESASFSSARQQGLVNGQLSLRRS